MAHTTRQYLESGSAGEDVPVPSSAPRAPIDPIGTVAMEEGVDPALLRAIRGAEGGGPGRQLGVLSVAAPTLEDQARVAARSLAESARRYEERTGKPAYVGGEPSQPWLRDFASRWAPIGAANDPSGLNRNFLRNLQSQYQRAKKVEQGAATRTFQQQRTGERATAPEAMPPVPPATPRPSSAPEPSGALDQLRTLVQRALNPSSPMETQPGGDVIVRDPMLASAVGRAAMAGAPATLAGLPGAERAVPLAPPVGPRPIPDPAALSQALSLLAPYGILGTPALQLLPKIAPRLMPIR